VADPDEKRRTIERALSYAERAVALQPNSAVNVLSLAICHGKLAAVSGVRQKIELSRRVRDEAQRAIDLDPAYGWADYVLGCWNLGVASLNGAERLVTRMFYGGLPPASVENAIRLLQRAVELDPNEPTHVIELGFAYRAAGRESEARAAFQRGLAMQSRETFDLEAQSRARLALADLGAQAR
jgi:tetratricopeptide (TPR) repeat protein